MYELQILSTTSLIIVNALVITFVFITLRKWGFDEYWWEDKEMNKIVNWCIHCFGFWVSVIVSMCYYVATKDYCVAIVPFTSTPIISILYANLI